MLGYRILANFIQMTENNHITNSIMKKFILLLLAILGYKVLTCQPSLGTCYHWEPGDNINIKLAAPKGPLQLCPGSELPLVINFYDLDKATCPKGTYYYSFPMAEYKVVFSTISTYASFSPTTHKAQKATTLSSVRFVPEGINNIVDLWLSYPVQLYISNNWDISQNIEIKVTVTELSSPMPACNDGNQIDPYATYIWSITPASIQNLPTGLDKNQTNPPDGSWKTEISPFTYEGIPKSPSTPYEGVIVKEILSNPIPIFDMNDIKDSWKNANPSLSTPQLIADMIFLPTIPHTFAFDTSNEFTDTHGSIADNPYYKSTDIFKQSARENLKVGYYINQEYVINCQTGATSLKTTITRRKNYKLGTQANPKIEISKTHQF